MLELKGNEWRTLSDFHIRALQTSESPNAFTIDEGRLQPDRVRAAYLRKALEHRNGEVRSPTGRPDDLPAAASHRRTRIPRLRSWEWTGASASACPFPALNIPSFVRSGLCIDLALHRKSANPARNFRVTRNKEVLTACSLALMIAPIVRNLSP